MEEQKIIGIDIGATKIHMGVVRGSSIVAEVKIPTEAQAPEEQIIANIKGGIAQLMDEQVAGIGIGVPGLVDEAAGKVYDITNIPAWQEVPLKENLQDYFNVPVYLTNDANTFVLGEKVFGKAQAYQNVVGLTLGTGLGAGIIINGDLYSGSFSSAGEIGSIPYLNQVVEDYCGGKFFLQQYGVEGNELKKRAKQGDTKALEAYEQYGYHLGNAINLVLHLLSPEAIFLGGSISKSFPLFKEAMLKQVQAFPFKRIRDKLVIEPSAMDNVAILGAVALFQMRHKHSYPANLALP
ncbi:glucokinase [Pontibacter ummariensis]|uniref:Glucokinase n=1 Tax=Pontibacter ummariensis TaxID=1610492 RepID=A0A239B6R5_9BACT|nr:ROK family protein [Pontibacter ummariensis]PRY16348.1 glucokinase [Pontibacter ummariensis]SNS03556.1 glucokinase [Pontibacter ummariensis]